jgi:hypothetical protein
VLKSRLSKLRYDENAVMHIDEVLPPRLPEATPKAICNYVLHPVGLKYKKGEKLEAEVLSEDEKLLLKQQTAALEAQVEEAKLQRSQLSADAMAEWKAQQASAHRAVAAASEGDVVIEGLAKSEQETATSAPSTVPSNGQSPPSIGSPPPADLTPQQRLINYVTDLQPPLKMDQIKQILDKRGVNDFFALTNEQAEEIYRKLFNKFTATAIETDLAAPALTTK